jgi:Protein of unknown function (DUF4242)
VIVMPRYLVERTFASIGEAAACLDASSCADARESHLREGVTWLHSYVAAGRGRSYCIVTGPSPAAIRRAASSSGMPVDRITEVRVLDPHAHHQPEELRP